MLICFPRLRNSRKHNSKIVNRVARKGLHSKLEYSPAKLVCDLYQRPYLLKIDRSGKLAGDIAKAVNRVWHDGENVIDKSTIESFLRYKQRRVLDFDDFIEPDDLF